LTSPPAKQGTFSPDAMTAPLSLAHPMLRLRGPVALSKFRIDKLLAPLQAAHAEITGISAEFAHFALLARQLETGERDVLEKLLTYGNASATQPDGTLLVVIPRIGTISPWSSKATESAALHFMC